MSSSVWVILVSEAPQFDHETPASRDRPTRLTALQGRPAVPPKIVTFPTRSVGQKMLKYLDNFVRLAHSLLSTVQPSLP